MHPGRARHRNAPCRERGTRRSDLGVLPAEFAIRFRPVAGIRYVIVHSYLDVDLTIVHRLLNDRLDDFTEFARLVSLYLDRRTKP